MVAENAKYTSLHRPPLAGQLIRSAFSTLLLTAMVLFSTVFIHAGNVLGYLNVGTHFNAFPPSLGGVEFSDALAFLKEVPFNKIDMLDKWVSPIRVRYEGHYNIKDIEVLNNIAQCFSSVEGFPGI